MHRTNDKTVALVFIQGVEQNGAHAFSSIPDM